MSCVELWEINFCSLGGRNLVIGEVTFPTTIVTIVVVLNSYVL